mgnify:CR=1 FL=1
MLAGQGSDVFTPTDLFGGEADIVTGTGTIAAGNTVAQYEVLGQLTATGEYVPYNPAGEDGSQNAVAIANQAIDASAGAVKGPIYLGGVFNPDALVWPEGATDAQKATAFSGTNIALRTPGYSG